MHQLFSVERQDIALTHFRQVVPLLGAVTSTGVLGLAARVPWAQIVSGTGTVLLSLVLLIVCVQHGMRVSRLASSPTADETSPGEDARAFVLLFSAGAVLAFELAALIAAQPGGGAGSGPFRLFGIVFVTGMLVLVALLVVVRLGGAGARPLVDPLTTLLVGSAEALPAVLGVFGLVRIADIASWGAVGSEPAGPMPSGAVVGLALAVMLAGAILRLSARVLIRIARMAELDDESRIVAVIGSPAGIEAPVRPSRALRA